MKSIARKVSFLALLLGSGLLIGCGGDGGPKARLSGSVTFDGNPVKSGQIIISPKDGAPGHASIVDGKYDTSATGGKSSAPGEATLRITGFGPPDGKFPNGVPLFVDYEMKKSITEGNETLDITVPKEAGATAPKEPPSDP